MNLDKLKEAARRHELRDEWRKAIEIYQKALLDLAQAGEPADPSLFNRIGDLELKAGETAEAIRAYEQAADAYADQGFFNNAIALCGKILRLTPGRTPTFLRLAELHARKNVVPEVRRNLAEYVERMAAASHFQPLEASLRGFSDRFAHTAELRALLADVLAGTTSNPDARSRLADIAGKLGLAEAAPASGDGGRSHPPQPATAGLVFLDTGIDIPGIALGGPSSGPPLVEELEPEIGLEQARQEPASLLTGRPGAIPPLSFIEPTALAGEDRTPGASTLAGLEPTAFDLPPALAAPTERLVHAPEPELVEIPGLEPLPEFEVGAAQGLGVELLSISDEESPLVLLDLPPTAPVRSRPVELTEPLFDQLDDDESPSRAGLATAPAREFMAMSPAELQELFTAQVEQEEWRGALDVLGELLRRSPNAVALHQERVQIAYRSGDRLQLVGAYLSLAQALERAGALENARLVYGRVLEHDPVNSAAATAVAALSAGAVPASGPGAAGPDVKDGGDFIDLGALILDPEPDRDSRMRVDQGEPESEEDVDFRETLEQFKQGIAENLELNDFQAHYDLGIAFKEMGLLDEAISQFQKALRSPDGRLRSSEALGTAFFEKGRAGIAESVLSRAIEALPGADDEKIGLIYWLGRAHEAQGRGEEALRWYERALAVDITFLDLSERIQRLSAERVQ